MHIVVTGLAVTYPFGGVFWDYLQYPLGFQRLGHEVLYIEETGRWCYDPAAQTFVESGSANANAFHDHLKRLDPALADRWFFRDATGKTFGMPWEQVTEFCRSADLLLHISASCVWREEYMAARCVAFLDSDPMYTQTGLLSSAAETDSSKHGIQAWIDHHQRFFTFGLNVGQHDSLVPTGPIHWIPTRQPVVLDCFTPHVRPVPQRRPVLTTVASWEPTEKGPQHEGVSYGGKSVEFQRFIDLPAQCSLPIEVAISGPAPRTLLQSKGWQLREGYDVSKDPWIYRDYLAESFAECSVAKDAYVAPRTGWFSCRTACYLALGVPAIVQDTGFSRFIPVGKGLLAFTTLDEARAAIDAVLTDPHAHSRAALEVAAECFDSRKVLRDLLDQLPGGR